MLKWAVAVAKGDVQSVGYRDDVLRIARRLGVTGQVINLRPYDVEIVAEGDEDTLRSFLDRIRIRKYPVFVDDLEVRWEQYGGDFEYFEIKRGEWQDEMLEWFDTACRLLYCTVELGERSVELGERSVELGEKTLNVAGKNLGLTEHLVRVGDQMLDKQDRTNEELSGIPKDVKSDMDQRFNTIEEQILEVRGALKKAGLMG